MYKVYRDYYGLFDEVSRVAEFETSAEAKAFAEYSAHKIAGSCTDFVVKNSRGKEIARYSALDYEEGSVL